MLFALGLELWGDTPRIVAKLLPTGTIEVLPDIDIGEDRLILFGVAVVLTAALTVVYRKHPLRAGDQRGGREPTSAGAARHLARRRRRRELGPRVAASPSSPRS